MKYPLYIPLALSATILSVPFAAGASEELARAKNCLACHGMDKKLVGPSLQDIAAKYKGDDGAPALLADKVKNGGGGNWGQIPMPPNAAVSDEDVATLVEWILSL